MKKIAIHQRGYIGNLGDTPDDAFAGLSGSGGHFAMNGLQVAEGKVSASAFNTFKPKSKRYPKLDRSTQLAIFAASQLEDGLRTDASTLVAIGSSRGATGTWEDAYDGFKTEGRSGVLDSPLTTPGQLSSNVGEYLNIETLIDVDQSITCASGLRAIADACAWINAGFVEQAVAGGSEAPLTPFTVSQMRALNIMSTSNSCRALDMSKESNTMVLGEGAVLFHLSARPEGALGFISGIGFSTEPGNSATGMSAEGIGFQRSMKMACEMAGWDRPDAIVAHAPGTLLGDLADLNAARALFGNVPVTTTKHKTGHMFGASGPMSVFMALEMMNRNRWIAPEWHETEKPNELNRLIINAVGFGANAISLAVEANHN